MYVLLFFILCSFSVNAAINPINGDLYETYVSYSDPVFSPWLSDPIFLEIDGGYTETIGNRAARYIEYILARQALNCRTGEFIECGVLWGTSLNIFAGVLDRFDSSNRALLGFDSFEGLDAPGAIDIDTRTNSIAPWFHAGGVCGGTPEQVQALLTHRKCKIELIKGWIPTTFQDYEERRFAFAHVDVDLYQATKDCLAFIYPRMVSGGIILFDDYGYSECAGAKKAVDEFLTDKPEILISLPTAQAFLIKLH